MAEPEAVDFSKLPVEERCVHKNWKARVEGYEEALKIFLRIDDEKSSEWYKFMGLIRKMIVDSNVMAQERGLEATLAFIENCAQAGKTVNDVMAGIVQKCIAAPKMRTKELAVQIALMYIEIEKQEAVVEELVKGMEHKNPKIVSACVAASTLALREFGAKVVSVKALIKKLAPLMSDRDKTVRDEGKLLAVEIYRWIGAAMKPQIASLPQITLKELEEEFDKLRGEKAEPLRYIRSQQVKQQEMTAVAAAVVTEGGNGTQEPEEEEIDPLDLIDPVDILSKMPKDFYEKLDEKKWTLRKEALETLEKLLTDNQKLESGDYGTLVNALRKVVSKDTNVVLVATAGKCLAMLARGLGKRFSPYATACVPTLLEKFKEKKSNVVAALRDAMDAIYLATSLDAIQDYIVESLGNKNPSVKAETASFLARAFARTQPATINKKLLKHYVATLLKTLNEPDPTVRDTSAEALGMLWKLMGDKAVAPLLQDVDSLKMVKIKECQEKAELLVKVAAVRVERPATAPSARTGTASKGGSTEPRPVARPATAGAKKAVAKKPPPAAAAVPTAAKAAKSLNSEREMSPEEINAKAEDLLAPDILSGLGDPNWKNRLAAGEKLLAQIDTFDSKTPGLSQALIRTVSGRKPGLKETNFQVLKVKLDIIRAVAETHGLSTVTVDSVVNEITEKLADVKNGGTASDVLTAFAEATKLELVVSRVLTFAYDQKSPKVQSEALNWVNRVILEFGFQIPAKLLVEDVRRAVQSTNPTVRGAAIGLIGTLAMYMGPPLMLLFDGEKPALKSQIQTEFDRNVGEKPPRPVRGAKRGQAVTVEPTEDEDAAEEEDQEQLNSSDMLSRVDISPLITPALLAEICEKDWKNRNEGLTKVQAIISEARLIKPNVSDLVMALLPRLADSNGKIAQATLGICEQLALAMGTPCKNFTRTLAPGMLHALGDSKAAVRAAALSAICAYGEKGGYKEFFEGEMIADALKSGSPSLKSEVWGWLAVRLPLLPNKTVPKEELNSMVPFLYAHICDRNAEVRKNANEAVLGIMIHLGFETMVRALDKQKPAAKKDIQAALDKARPNLPMKPLPKGKQQAPIIEEPKKIVRGGGGGGAPKGGAGGSKKVGGDGGGATTARKKEEDHDNSPLLVYNTTKNQRLIDEQKMRVLKWTFTQPREEFAELLREQMFTANVNKALMANMFHDDFRYHLKVIESLSEDLGPNRKALVANLDLILKWLTLRFYDTNPSVLIKGLEYLHNVFNVLVEEEYILSDSEGNAFMPHLILKLGDPKDAVRNAVRTLLRQILLVFPYTKMFSFVMDGLKSKNARQRTECLDELGFLIENYSLSVCQPSQQVALKEVARHISDRDNSVRNAALNCVVQAFFLAGERVYKLIGQLNEKDLSMLDERIKRAKKTKKSSPPMEPAAAAPMPRASVAASPAAVARQESVEHEEAEEANGPEEHEEQYLPMPSRPEGQNGSTEERGNGTRQLRREATFDQPSTQSTLPQLQQQQQQQQQQGTFTPSGPFRLDPNVIAEIEKDWVLADQLQQVEVPRVDISLLFEPIKVIPSREGVQYPQEKFDQLIARSRYMQSHTTPPPAPPSAITGTMSSPYGSPQQMQPMRQPPTGNSPNLADALPKLDPQLVRLIKSISSADTLKARAAINEVTEILDSHEKQAVMKDYEEILIQNVLTQLKNLTQMPTADCVAVYQPLLSITFTFFNAKPLGKNLSITTIKNLMATLLNLMADQRAPANDDGQFTKVVNGICLKVLDKTNFTNLNCALIRLLRESCPVAGLPKFTDLLMKCIWRNVKMLPERSNELNYDAVVLEVHEFMITLPSSWWATRPSDTPLRTIKTIVHNMVKIKGSDIYQHLSQVPTHSELYGCIIKIMKNLQKDGNLTGTSQQRSTSGQSQPQLPKRISHQAHETMSQIFKLISEKDTKQQGLQKLYEFKVQYPDIDVSTFLKGSTPHFQKYIETSLTDVERSAMMANGGSTRSTEVNAQQPLMGVASGAGGDSGCMVNRNDPEMWMDRLNTLRAKANLPPHRNPDGSLALNAHMLDNKVVDENLNLNAMNAAHKASLIRKDKPEMSPNRLQHIQAKLAQLKRENNS